MPDLIPPRKSPFLRKDNFLEKLWDYFFDNIANSLNWANNRDPLIDVTSTEGYKRTEELYQLISTEQASRLAALDLLEKKLLAEIAINMATVPITINNIIGEEMLGTPDLTVTVDFSAVGWKEAGTHELFTITGGEVHCFINFKVLQSLVTGSIQAGTASDTDALFPSTSCSVLTIGRVWKNDATAAKVALAALGVVEFFTTEDIGYEKITEATAGEGIFNLWWEAVDSGAMVTLGAGGVL